MSTIEADMGRGEGDGEVAAQAEGASSADGARALPARGDLRGQLRGRGRFRGRRGLDDTSMRSKVTLLVMLAALSGAGLGMAQAELGRGVWPMLLGLSVLCMGLKVLGEWWVAGPVDRLTRGLERAARTQRAVQLKDLPVDRKDEVGRIARAMRQVTLMAIQSQGDAHRLRKTMDTKVQQQTRRATRKLHRIAMRDPLTELGNRRYLEAKLGPTLDQARREGAEVVAVMIDLDNFKAVNDTLGHPAGDALIRLLAELVRSSVRPGDLCVRLGGDEFALVMPGATVNRADRLVANIRTHFRRRGAAMHPDGPRADVSAGIAALLADRCETGEALLKRADARLYHAKASGKGCTRSAA